MKRFFVVLFILLCIVLLGSLNLLFSQNSKDFHKSIKANSEGFSKEKRQIKNYQDENLDKVKSELIHKKIATLENIKESTKGVSGKSNIQIEEIYMQFKEDSQKKGYPIGWITNCSTPILRKYQNRNYLELNDFNSDIYLAKYINVNSNNKYQLILSFNNLSNIRLIISEYSENNETTTKPRIFNLPNGEFEYYTIDINILETTEKLFIRFDKKIYGEFILKNFRLEEVER